MHIPRTGERVFVNKYQAIFTVAYTYHETQTADLLPVGSGLMKDDVSWRKLTCCWPSPIATINTTPGNSDVLTD
jgi:hypothetical protein